MAWGEGPYIWLVEEGREDLGGSFDSVCLKANFGRPEGHIILFGGRHNGEDIVFLQAG